MKLNLLDQIVRVFVRRDERPLTKILLEFLQPLELIVDQCRLGNGCRTEVDEYTCTTFRQSAYFLDRA